MYQLPQNKTWTQTNQSDRFGSLAEIGSLAETRNIDLDYQGYIRLAERSRSIFDSTLDANLGPILSIVYDQTNTQYHLITDDGVFIADRTLKTVTQDSSTNVPTNLTSGSDLIIFEGVPHIACITDGLRSYNGTQWSTDLAPSSLSGVAPMAVFESQVALAIGQDEEVMLLDSSYALLETLVLPNQYRVSSLDWVDNAMWIGTKHRFGGDAMLFVWDGNAASANAAYPVGCSRIDSVKRWQGTVAVFTGDGRLLAFNGGGFSLLGALPTYYTSRILEERADIVLSHTSHRGMVVDGDKIYVNLETNHPTSDDNVLQKEWFSDTPSGVWCYDPGAGFYHKYSISADLKLQTNAVTTANVNTSTEVITVAGQAVPETGTPVFYDDGANGAGTAIGGLTHRKKYYVIYQSDTTMKLATTAALAAAGTAIDLTGTGNNAQFFIFQPNRDFGGTKGESSVAISKVEDEQAIETDGKWFLFGGTVRKTSSTEVQTLNTVVAEQENRGHLVTARLEAQGQTDKFTDITIKFKDLRLPEDKIVVKARIVERDDDLMSLDTTGNLLATFTDGNTFTSTATELADAVAGDEVTFRAGTGMGWTAHITSISENAGTYTVNIDETITNLAGSDTCLFTVENWQKLGEITTDDVDTFYNQVGTAYNATGGVKSGFQIEAEGRFLQVKLELRGEQVTVEDILVNNKSFKSIIV